MTREAPVGRELESHGESRIRFMKMHKVTNILFSLDRKSGRQLLVDHAYTAMCMRESWKHLQEMFLYAGKSIFKQDLPANRGGGCTVCVKEVVGRNRHQEVCLHVLKLVPSILFLSDRRTLVYIEFEIFNPHAERIILDRVVLDIAPTPGANPQCASHLFKEIEGDHNGAGAWRSMFRDFEEDRDWQKSFSFGYALDLKLSNHNKNRTRRIHITPTLFEFLETSKSSSERRLVLGNFSCMNGNPAAIAPTGEPKGRIDAIAFYLLLPYQGRTVQIDEASSIHDFDFLVEDNKSLIRYFSFFGVLPQHALLSGSSSSTTVETHSPANVKNIFAEWQNIKACPSTRSHRVVRATRTRFNAIGAYIEMLLLWPKRGFRKTVISFILALVSAAGVNALIALLIARHDGLSDHYFAYSFSAALVLIVAPIFCIKRILSRH